MKKIKCFVEICYCGSKGCTPTIWNTKPTKRELKNCHEFNYKVFPATIIYNYTKEIK